MLRQEENELQVRSLRKTGQPPPPCSGPLPQQPASDPLPQQPAMYATEFCRPYPIVVKPQGLWANSPVERVLDSHVQALGNKRVLLVTLKGLWLVGEVGSQSPMLIH